MNRPHRIYLRESGFPGISVVESLPFFPTTGSACSCPHQSRGQQPVFHVARLQSAPPPLHVPVTQTTLTSLAVSEAPKDDRGTTETDAYSATITASAGVRLNSAPTDSQSVTYFYVCRLCGVSAMACGFSSTYLNNHGKWAGNIPKATDAFDECLRCG